MGKIFKNQSNLKITLQTGVTLTGAIATMIAFTKPDGTQSSWLGSIVGTEDIEYDFSDDELDQSDIWIWWAYVIFADGRNAPGNAFKVKVYEQGET